jgi:predicted transcriptional regulator of viral defense system
MKGITLLKHVLTYIRKHGGYATMKEMKAASIQTRDIAALLKEGEIERIKPGLYRLSGHPSETPFRATLTDICEAMPKGVICLLSALEYHGLTTANPSEVYVAIPHGAKPQRIHYPPIKPFFFRERFYAPGILYVGDNGGDIRVYDKEKTICDTFRYRNKLGEEIAFEALKSYLRQKGANRIALQKYAAICQVKTVLVPYLRALSA